MKDTTNSLDHKKVHCISGGLRATNNSCAEIHDERLSSHPCYSEEASHKYARMHLPVAPKCNIQCNYCVRKYDCVNESRPGVTSSVLSPEEAVLKAFETKDNLKELSVIGIAGPGDPLANPDETFDTFRMIRINMPDVNLCLSTNGLKVPDYIEAIKSIGVSHVTITINAVDPVIGKLMYSNVRYKGITCKGIEAASLLIEKQLEGARLLKETGILLKINSVLVPGINDDHLHEVSKRANELGADIYNIMPYIPCEGSHFYKSGIVARPTSTMVNELRLKCGGNQYGQKMKIMRHCKQCRADAVGFLSKNNELENFPSDQQKKLALK